MVDPEEENKKLKSHNSFLTGRLHELETSFSWQVSQEINLFFERILPEGGFGWSLYVRLIRGLKSFINSFDRVVSRRTRISESYNSYIQTKSISVHTYISIVMPVYNTPIIFLQKAIKSIIDQTYKKWQLVIIDDCSPNRNVKQFLDQIIDPRILVIYNDKNKGIAGTQNIGIKHCKGKYVAFFDHDDELNPNALAEIAYCIEQSSPEIIYTDEQHIDRNSIKTSGYSKPGYSADLLLVQNYFNHLTVIKKDLLKKIGGFRHGFEGSQDHDMLLRATELVKDSSIAHIPKILYSWRQFSNSFSNKPKTKRIAIDSAIKAINQALRRRGIDGYAEENRGAHIYRVRRKVIGNPKVSIIIPFKNKYELLKNCLDSIINKSTYKNIEVLCIDNQSTDIRTRIFLEDLCGQYDFVHRYEFDKPFNFSEINNWAVMKSDGEHIIFLNNDTEVISPDWIEQLLEQSQRSDVAFVGGLLLYPNNKIQHAGIAIGLGGIAGGVFPNVNPLSTYYRLGYITRDVTAVTAACMMVGRKVFDLLGGFDEKLAIAYNDVDICIRALEQGYKNIYTPFSSLYHLESVSRGYENTPQRLLRYQTEINYILLKHPVYFSKGDPHYRADVWY